VTKGLSVTFVGAALALAGPGAITAAGATTVLSDTAKFVAQGTGSITSFTLQNVRCALTSDTEGAVPCQISGNGGGAPAPGGSFNLNVTLTSSDGTTSANTVGTWAQTSPSSATFKTKGKGVEQDNPDKPGTPPPPPYPCIVKVSGTISSSGLFMGKVVVSEGTTQP
jgi:hypothetical protein